MKRGGFLFDVGAIAGQVGIKGYFRFGAFAGELGDEGVIFFFREVAEELVVSPGDG